MAGRINDNKTRRACQRINGIGESCLPIVRICVTIETNMVGNSKVAANMLCPGTSVLNVIGERLLPRIEIDSGNAVPRFHQGNRKMHGDRRFAGSAFFITHKDHLSGSHPRWPFNRHGLSFENLRNWRHWELAALILIRRVCTTKSMFLAQFSCLLMLQEWNSVPPSWAGYSVPWSNVVSPSRKVGYRKVTPSIDLLLFVRTRLTSV